MNSPLEAALFYASSLKWRVFPVAGKIPVTKRGVLDATTDENFLKQWWRSDANYGVALSTGQGLIVLDVDPKYGGDDSLAELESKYGDVPETLRSVTPSGGCHYFFTGRTGIRNSVSKLGSGLDIRSDGGYVVIPPSPNYHWDLGSPESLAPIPEWLIPKETRRAFSGAVEGPVPRGQRHAFLVSAAGVLRHNPAFTYKAILAALLEVNAERCSPPCPEPDVEKIAQAIMRYEPEYVNYSTRRRASSSISRNQDWRNSAQRDGDAEVRPFRRPNERPSVRVGAWYLRGGR